MQINSTFATAITLQNVASAQRTSKNDNQPGNAETAFRDIPLNEGRPVRHTTSAVTDFNFEARYRDNPPLKTQLMSVDEMKNYWQNYGQSRDFTAIAYIDGEPAIMFGKHTTSRNQFSRFTNTGTNASNNTGQTLSALKSEYGNRLSVEYFTQPHGPTNAEAFELFNGTSFDGYVAEQVGNALSAQATQEQQRMARQQRQLAWDNTPVNAIFRVNDTIIASTAEDKVNLHTNNLLTIMDNIGVSREQAQTLYRNTIGKPVNAHTLEQQLASIFGSSLSSEYPDGNSRPTRKAVSVIAEAQYRQSY